MKFIDLKNIPCWNYEGHDESKCEKCEHGDKTIFTNTEYSGIEFVKEASWAEFPDIDKYASPVFKFENGDRVVFDKTGLLRKISKKSHKSLACVDELRVFRLFFCYF